MIGTSGFRPHAENQPARLKTSGVSSLPAVVEPVEFWPGLSRLSNLGPRSKAVNISRRRLTVAFKVQQHVFPQRRA